MVTRREVLAAVGGVTLGGATLGGMALGFTRGGTPPVAHLLARAPAGLREPPYLFFDAAEALFIEAACERLIPRNDESPGALGANAAHYLDTHLAGAWGNGGSLYREGLWQPGTPDVGAPHPEKPADLFRSALRAIRRSSGRPFGEWPNDAQDEYLRSLQSGAALLDGVPAWLFFEMLLRMTVEAYFSVPQVAAARDRVTWTMRGFPGAFALAVNGA